MKLYKVFLIGLFFLTSNLSYSQGVVTLINRSDDFFQALDQGKFEAAQSLFDESVKEKITPDVLKSFWANLTAQLGTFESVEDANSKIQGDYFVVILNCKFSKGIQAFQFAYNKSEKMVGFVIVNSPDAVYVSPAYADTTLYKEEFITINSAGHELAGMLTAPKGLKSFPVVVLVHGSGPLDMDETVGPNKPFKDLAAGLAAKGIATVRYVKRSMRYPNEFSKVFTVKEEVLDDAVTAVNFAKNVPGADKKQIYLLGHSLGGMLAPRLAALVPDLNGIILAEAPARKFTDLMVEQNRYMFEAAKDTTAAVKKRFEDTMKQLERTRISKLGAIPADSLILGVPASYWVDLNQYDQLATAKKLKNRIMVIQGEHDFQVSVNDYNLWKSTLSNNKNVSFKLYPDINHLLSSQPEKGTLRQYENASNVAANVIDDIASWIKAK